MNFLAHAYLSFDHPQVLAGNMISDFVKGKAQYDFAPLVQAGIKLHRSIDKYTDDHWATKGAQEIFRPAYRLYSGPIMDVIYDHFLATDPIIFNNHTLRQFSQKVYATLDTQSFYLPVRFLNMLPYMKAQDWLKNYNTVEGIERSLAGLVRRSSFMNDHQGAVSLFLEHYELLRSHYNSFFGDLKQHAAEKFEELVK
ncbi:MAG TPA: ACP phosphodiesterase [Flavisolibacter sp.]